LKYQKWQWKPSKGDGARAAGGVQGTGGSRAADEDVNALKSDL